MVRAHHNLRLADQGAFYNPPEEPQFIELDMEKFNRSAMAIARDSVVSNRVKSWLQDRALKLVDKIRQSFQHSCLIFAIADIIFRASSPTGRVGDWHLAGRWFDSRTSL